MERSLGLGQDTDEAGQAPPSPARPRFEPLAQTPELVHIADPEMDSALDQLIILIEQQMPAMRGSILLVDDDGQTLHHGAGPSLPREYCRLIDGSRAGPRAGSCGTATYRREQVIVEDIAVDPLWTDYRDLALPYGLRACWSTPFLDGEGEVLGTFAMYYAEPRLPTAEEQRLIQTAALLAANIVLRARAAEALARSEERTRAARLEAEEANRAKSDFLARMSHDLRTPLNAIGGYAMLMLDGIPEAASVAHQDFLERIVRAKDHLLALVDALLTHAKLEAGQMTYSLESVALRDILHAVDALVSPLIAAKELQYDCSGCDRALVLRCDREKTLQILLNLLSNAVKFTPTGGQISLRTIQPDSERVILMVRDTGVGMSRSELDNLFQPFVQFENVLTQREKGTGLGTAISRELARGMGGELTADSEPGRGSDFLLTLPLDRRGPSTPSYAARR